MIAAAMTAYRRKTMTTELSDVQKHVDAARVLEVEQALLRIPGATDRRSSRRTDE
jgi:hypothetical protein